MAAERVITGTQSNTTPTESSFSKGKVHEMVFFNLGSEDLKVRVPIIHGDTDFATVAAGTNRSFFDSDGAITNFFVTRVSGTGDVDWRAEVVFGKYDANA